MHAQPVWWMQEAVLCSANVVDLLFLLFFFSFLQRPIDALSHF